MKINVWAILILFTMAACSKSDDVTSTIQAFEQSEIQNGKETRTIEVDGTQRKYILYTPEDYTEDQSYPLLFAFHGLGGNMNSSYNNSQLHLIAEREKFILVHPEGLSARWNVLSVSDNIDLDFVRQLLLSLQQEFNIDANRIYSTGMSNGGYFSFLLACELTDQIAGIASVTGLMFKPVLNQCNPSKPISILQIHGTADDVVDYNNVAAVLDFWKVHNNTNADPIISEIPDIDPNDASSAERFVYNCGQNSAEVHHIKITGGGHDWPGHKGNMDINASEVVWDFLKDYTLEGKVE